MKKEELQKLVEDAIDGACGNDGTQRLYPADSYLASSIIQKLTDASMLMPLMSDQDPTIEDVMVDLGSMVYSYKRPKT